MPLRTTTIGAYPKPDYVPIPDWFQEENTVAMDPTKALDNCTDCQGPEAEELMDRATREVVLEQVRLCIDVPTDGEVRRENYFRLAQALDNAALDVISIEDAHHPNDLTLLELFRHQTIILGVIGIARSRIESVEEIASRLRKAMDHIDQKRLMVAPDCGLGMLSRRQVKAKLQNMVKAAQMV